MQQQRYGLGSSHYAWSAGMEADAIDPLLIQPHTSWRGTRGARVTFGGDQRDRIEVAERELIKARAKISPLSGIGVRGSVEQRTAQLLGIAEQLRNKYGIKKSPQWKKAVDTQVSYVKLSGHLYGADDEYGGDIAELDALADALAPAKVMATVPALEKAISGVINPGDTNELAYYIFDELGSTEWSSLSRKDQINLLQEALKRCVVPGMEPDLLSQVSLKGISKLSAYSNFGMGEPEHLLVVKLSAPDPGLLNLIDRSGAANVGDISNPLALRYWIWGELEPSFYKKLADIVSGVLDSEDEDFGADFDAYGDIDSQIEEMFGELEDELDDEIDEAEEEYGRLYLKQPYYRLSPSSSGDLGALIGRSGTSGYRGGRPSYGAGAEVSFGPIQYKGNDVGAFLLGLGGLLVLSKGVGLF